MNLEQRLPLPQGCVTIAKAARAGPPPMVWVLPELVCPYAKMVLLMPVAPSAPPPRGFRAGG